MPAPGERQLQTNNRLRQDAWLRRTLQGWGNECRIEIRCRSPSCSCRVCATDRIWRTTRGTDAGKLVAAASDWTLSFGDHSAARFSADLGYRDTIRPYFAPSINRITQRSLTFSPARAPAFASLGSQRSDCRARLGDWNYDRQIDFPGFPNSSTPGRSGHRRLRALQRAAHRCHSSPWGTSTATTDHRVARDSALPTRANEKPHAGELGVNSRALRALAAVRQSSGQAFASPMSTRTGLRFPASCSRLRPLATGRRASNIVLAGKGACQHLRIDLDKNLFQPIVVAFGANTNLSRRRRSGPSSPGNGP